MGARVDSGTPAPAQPARATETRAIIPKWRQVFGPGVLAFTRITYIEIRGRIQDGFLRGRAAAVRDGLLSVSRHQAATKSLCSGTDSIASSP